MLTQEKKQELFTNALNGVVGQGGYAFGVPKDVPLAAPPGCYYRLFLPDGRALKCGIGHSIPDERYDPAMEGQDVCSVAVLDALGLLEELTRMDVCADDFDRVHDRSFLNRLQNLHDGCARARMDMSEFIVCMTTFAAKEGLIL